MLGERADLDQVVLDQLAYIDVRDRQAVRLDVSLLLARYLASDDPRLRKQAALSLGRLHAFEFTERLIEALDDHDRGVVRAAVRTDAAVSALVDLLERDDESVRAAALAALVSVTGVRGEATPEWWRDWLRGRVFSPDRV